MSRRLVRCWFPVLAALSVLAATVRAAEPDQGEKTKIPWQTDLRAAHKLAVRQQKPMLVVFGADWCVYCKKLEGETLGQPAMAEYVRREFIPVHLDFDREEKAAEILEVTSLPCTIILSPQADLLGRIDGYVQAAAYQSALRKAREVHRQIRTAQHSEASRQ